MNLDDIDNPMPDLDPISYNVWDYPMYDNDINSCWLDNEFIDDTVHAFPSSNALQSWQSSYNSTVPLDSSSNTSSNEIQNKELLSTRFSMLQQSPSDCNFNGCISLPSDIYENPIELSNTMEQNHFPTLETDSCNTLSSLDYECPTSYVPMHQIKATNQKKIKLLFTCIPYYRRYSSCGQCVAEKLRHIFREKEKSQKRSNYSQTM